MPEPALRSAPNTSARWAHIVAVGLGPTVWLLLSYGLGVSERYLPSPHTVFRDTVALGPVLAWHFAVSFFRIAVGYVAGIVVGLFLAELLFRSRLSQTILLPNIHAARAIPASASIPFFILWFGFSEVGKVFIFIFGVSLNFAVAAWQVLRQMPERYTVALTGFGVSESQMPRSVLFPLALEQLLPTLRFSLTVAIGLGVVAELLGAQSGLGYLIQSARATYSMGIIFACMCLFGAMTILMDLALKAAWRHFIPWKLTQET
jgi:sulfonate transport system permease protein